MKKLACMLLLFPLCVPVTTWCALPLADVHVHYKWSQADVTSVQQAADILQANDIALAVVIGTPAEFALRLQQQAPQRVVALWSPYEKPGDWSTWAYDRQVLQEARSALASGRYQGIGELHLIGGFAPDWQTAVVSGLAELAGAHKVPLLLHTEFSRPDYLLGLCRAFPQTRFLWAHAGAILSAAQVSEVMTSCPNVWSELSARDPWRFINNPITNGDGELLPAWRTLIASFPDRFMIGSDPVWPVDNLDSWDEPDRGWQQYRRFIDFHRHWLTQLPPELARKVGLKNAREFFK